ncbi:MAG: dihydroneopterin aldolase [Bacteroidetes bacterium]|jgi:dihydroneopterin aldolase|uniref:7,8-dihydroneopterin aldolase n=1 Tax=Candidatus Cryptobacteroides avicola TaxID=2840757 RepID=A0A940IHA8_9BACT|nr:dihydroneopterin aldolase [Candidatus Cryptobacteroides avicola]
MDILELEGMEFWARHGCLPHEKESENLFVVDFRAETDMTAAAESDRIEDTVDYGRIYDITARVMNGGHAGLLEHLAGKIVKAISAEFPDLQEFSVRVSKRRPPVNGVAAWSRVTLVHTGK